MTEPTDMEPLVIQRSVCQYCRQVVELTDEPDAVWTSALGAGRTPECRPGSVPFPGHKPGKIAYPDHA